MPDPIAPNDPDAMLQLKLEVPRQPSSVIDRPRLRTALDSVTSARLLLLTAPAGFGKTTLLAQWHEHLLGEGHRVGWVTLDEGDSDPRLFLVGLIFALRAAGVEISRLLTQAESGLPEVTIDSVLRSIRAAITECPTPVSLFLDDYHRAAGKALDNLIEHLVALLPEHARLFLSARVRPDINVPRLLATGAAAEFSSDMLRFTSGESRRVLNAGLNEADLNALVNQVEGWPVALQLARLVIAQERDAPCSLSRLTARGGHLSGFLTDQVLKNLPGEVVDFLLETSILEKFNVEIADAVRERSDSWQIMDALEPLQSLLAPLDPDNVWFRYHHLFAEYLQSQLRQRRPGIIVDLHLRASKAFEDSGLLVEAVRHARDAGNYERCAELIETAGGWRLVLLGGIALLNQLLEFIPQAERLSHPRRLVAEAYLNLKMGNIKQAIATFDLVGRKDIEPWDEWSALDDYARDAVSVGILIRSYEDNDLDENVLESFRRMRNSLTDADGLTLGVLECTGAVAALCLGQLDEAEGFAREAMTAMRSVNSMIGLNYCFLHAGLASLYRGQIRTAAAYLTQAQAMANENFGADSGLKAISDILLGSVELWRGGDAVSVPGALDQAFRYACEFDGWFDVYCAALDTRVGSPGTELEFAL